MYASLIINFIIYFQVLWRKHRILLTRTYFSVAGSSCSFSICGSSEVERIERCRRRQPPISLRCLQRPGRISLYDWHHPRLFLAASPALSLHKFGKHKEKLPGLKFSRLEPLLETFLDDIFNGVRIELQRCDFAPGHQDYPQNYYNFPNRAANCSSVQRITGRISCAVTVEEGLDLSYSKDQKSYRE